MRNNSLKRLASVLRDHFLSLYYAVVRPLAAALNPKTRVLFVVINEIGFVAQQNLIDLLSRDDQFHVALVRDPDHLPPTTFLGFNETYRHQVISPLIARLLPWHYAIFTDISSFRCDGIGVHIHHGSCCGNMAPSSTGDYGVLCMAWDRVQISILNGPAELEYIRENRPELLEVSSKALFLFGNSKLAVLGNPNTVDKGNQLRASFSDPEFVWMLSSHWTEMSLLRQLGAAFIRDLVSSYPSLFFVVTAHPKLWTIDDHDGFSGAFLRSEISELADEFDNLRVIESGFPYPMMQASDGLICDHSSIRVEYAFLNKPVCLYRHPEFRSESEVTHRLYNEASNVFSDLRALKQILGSHGRNTPSRSAANARLKRYFATDEPNVAARIRDVFEAGGPSQDWAAIKSLEVRPVPDSASASPSTPSFGV